MVIKIVIALFVGFVLGIAAFIGFLMWMGAKIDLFGKPPQRK